MKDTIYRQAAIDEVRNYYDPEDHSVESIEDRIKKLPSAQPEIIRCKDCKHRHIENMVWTCPFGLPGGELFFCAYGAERRTDG